MPDLALTVAAATAGLALGPLLQTVADALVAAREPAATRSLTAVPSGVGGPAAGRDGGRSGAAAAGGRVGRPARSWPGRVALPLLTGALFAAMAATLGAEPALPAFLLLSALGITLAAVDLRTHLLPDVLTLPAYPISAALLATAALFGSPSGSLMGAALGGVASYAFYGLLRLGSPSGIGFGDVKLAGVLGLYTGWLGWGPWVLGLFTASLYAALVGVALLAAGAARRSPLAMGPHLVAGCVTGVLFGQQALAAAV